MIAGGGHDQHDQHDQHDHVLAFDQAGLNSHSNYMTGCWKMS